jgi:hypothetical protein
MNAPDDASSRHLLGRLRVIERCVRAAVEVRRATDASPDDRFRGLYISDEEIDRLLGARAVPGPAEPSWAGELAVVEASADDAESRGADIRLRRLARAFGLDRIDVTFLLIALAPDLDVRFERLYAYLHDDVSRRRASTGLALELVGSGPFVAADRARLSPGATLVEGGLLTVDDQDRPFLTRTLSVPDRIARFLLGDDLPDQILRDVLTHRTPVDECAVRPIVRAIHSGARLCHVIRRNPPPGPSLGAEAMVLAGVSPLVIDVSDLDRDIDPGAIAAAAIREARLEDAGIVFGPIDELVERDPSVIRTLCHADRTVVLFGRRGWDPSWARTVPFVVEAPAVSSVDQTPLWRSALGGEARAEPEPWGAVTQFRLTPEQIVRAAKAASLLASSEGRAIGAADLLMGARAQNSTRLENMSRLIQPEMTWADLVLPSYTLDQLRELAARVRNRDRVSGMVAAARPDRHRGVTALFAGDSGTGKTMSAEVLAGELGLHVYVIDLSTVIDKYVGETEKNLDRIFAEAEGVNGILLFDEADALFGKRGEQKDAKDRWANLEVAYLLQRMELFDGVAILTTNLRANLDDAFARRLDEVVTFPSPDEDQRRRLWTMGLSGPFPVDPNIDVRFLARSFRVSGGNIRNIIVTAAYLAAEEQGCIGMGELIRAVQREYKKLGRLCVEAEFGPYYPIIATPAAAS